MLFRYLIYVLFISVTQAAPRSMSRALSINDSLDSDINFSDIIATKEDPEEVIQSTGDDQNPELIEPLDSYEKSNDLISVNPYPETTENGDAINGLNLGAEDFLASSQGQTRTTPRPAEKVPENTGKDGTTTPGSAPKPGMIQQPPRNDKNPTGLGSSGGENYGAGKADCKTKTKTPWADKGCSIRWPRSTFTAAAFTKCQIKQPLLNCVLCATASPDRCYLYRSVYLDKIPKGKQVPKSKLVPAGEKLY